MSPTPRSAPAAFTSPSSARSAPSRASSRPRSWHRHRHCSPPKSMSAGGVSSSSSTRPTSSLRPSWRRSVLRLQIVSVLTRPLVPPARAVAHQSSPDGRSPSLHPRYRVSSLLRDRPPLLAPRRYSAPHDLPRLGVFLSRSVRPAAASFAVSGAQLPTFHIGAQIGLTPPIRRMPPGRQAGLHQACPEAYV